MENHGSRWPWVLQAISGIALVLLVGLHWVAQHYLASGGLRSYAEVVSYLKQPATLALEAAFLIVVTGHALLGVRSILVDLGLPPTRQRWLDVSLWAVGILAVSYGLQLTWQIISQ